MAWIQSDVRLLFSEPNRRRTAGVELTVYTVTVGHVGWDLNRGRERSRMTCRKCY